MTLLEQAKKVYGDDITLGELFAFMELEAANSGVKEVENGGPGSGNYGHSGRPGQVGGSSGTSFVTDDKTDDYYDPIEDSSQKIDTKVYHYPAVKGTKEEKNSLRFYCGPMSSYMTINGYLRGQKDYKDLQLDHKLSGNNAILENPPVRLGRQIDNMDNLINKNKAPENMYVYRVMRVKKSDAAQMVEAGGFMDKGFVSTSIKPHGLESWGTMIRDDDARIVTKIRVRKGQKGVFATKASDKITDEGEFILPRNTKFKITKSYTAKPGSENDDDFLQDYRGELRLEMEII